MTAPSSSNDWPVEVRRYLTQRALDALLEQHGGWQGLAQWLYGGRPHALAQGGRVPYAAGVDFLWPLITSDAAAWAAERRGK